MGLLAWIKGEEPSYFRKVLVQEQEGVGGLGEYLIEYALEHGKLGESAVVFRNVLVPRSSGPTDTSEVDVLMLHEKGIFVFESKNFDGWIFGNADHQKWTQSLQGGHKEHFYNPIKQNRAHVRSLAAHLGLDEGVFRSYIVFSNRCEFKTVPESTSDYVVCQRKDLLRMLRRDLDELPVIYHEAGLGELRRRIEGLLERSTDEAREAHVEAARRVKDGEVCPYCGGELVLRNGKFGEFYGCSNYPRCKFTRKV